MSTELKLENMFGPEVVAALEERMRQIARETKPAPVGEEDRGLTAEEAAAELGVKKWRVYEMCRRKALAHYYPSPKTLRIRRSVVEAFKANARP